VIFNFTFITGFWYWVGFDWFQSIASGISARFWFTLEYIKKSPKVILYSGATMKW